MTKTIKGSTSTSFSACECEPFQHRRLWFCHYCRKRRSFGASVDVRCLGLNPSTPRRQRSTVSGTQERQHNPKRGRHAPHVTADCLCGWGCRPDGCIGALKSTRSFLAALLQCSPHGSGWSPCFWGGGRLTVQAILHP